MNYILLKNNNKINIDLIGKHVPFTFVRSRKLHIDVCDFIASNFYSYNKDTDRWKVLVNFLSQRSAKAKYITAIILLSRKEKIKMINADYIGKEFQVFFSYNIEFSNQKSHSTLFIDNSQLYQSIVKYFPNLIFRLFRNRFINSQLSVIRSWVDVDEKLHQTYFNNSTIYIYPFGINLTRSLKHIRHCFKKYNNVSLMGVPYSFFKLIKLIFGKDKDGLIIDYEIDAYNKHTQDFKNYDNIHTSDDYIPAVYMLYNNLPDNVRITNRAHGIGFYNPYINYTDLHLLNDAQKSYYSYRNSNIRIRSNSMTIKDNPSYDKDKNEISIVLIDQGDLGKRGLVFEDILQKKVYDSIFNLSNSHNFNYWVKFHPNRKQLEKNNFSSLYGKNCSELKNIQQINNIVFINLYSTAYYDLRAYGEVLFIKTDFFDPCILFGNSIKLIDLKQLDDIILSYHRNTKNI